MKQGQSIRQMLPTSIRNDVKIHSTKLQKVLLEQLLVAQCLSQVSAPIKNLWVT